MNSDIKIVLQYVEPKDLGKFFNKHHIDFSFKFRYDARPHELVENIFDCIFENFPNIVLIGANIKFNADYGMLKKYDVMM